MHMMHTPNKRDHMNDKVCSQLIILFNYNCNPTIHSVYYIMFIHTNLELMDVEAPSFVTYTLEAKFQIKKSGSSQNHRYYCLSYCHTADSCKQ